jgi:hypothetical protein
VRALAENGLVVLPLLSFGSPVDWSKVQGQLDALLTARGRVTISSNIYITPDWTKKEFLKSDQ